jgi:hypothetical protein
MNLELCHHLKRLTLIKLKLNIGHVSFQNTGLPNQNIWRYQPINEIRPRILHISLCSLLNRLSTTLVLQYALLGILFDPTYDPTNLDLALNSP